MLLVQASASVGLGVSAPGSSSGAASSGAAAASSGAASGGSLPGGHPGVTSEVQSSAPPEGSQLEAQQPSSEV